MDEYILTLYVIFLNKIKYDICSKTFNKVKEKPVRKKGHQDTGMCDIC